MASPRLVKLGPEGAGQNVGEYERDREREITTAKYNVLREGNRSVCVCMAFLSLQYAANSTWYRMQMTCVCVFSYKA